jgi:hypothetical protein
VGWLYIALLAVAVVVLAAAEWPRLEPKLGLEGRRRRERSRRKAHLKIVHGTRDDDDFAASVQRDLARLPTTDRETDRR